MTEYRVEPISLWPGEPTKYRKTSNFSADYSATLQLLERELWQMDAKAVVLQLDVGAASIRLDGMLRASARPEHPGVIVNFTSNKLGKLRFACDRFINWQDNLRAIALGMEALRKVDRYGVTSDGQQYAGFKALEAGAGATGFTSREDAARYIAMQALGDGDEYRAERIAAAMLIDDELTATYYRRAAKNAHPDAGGDDVTMARLASARGLLEDAPA